MPTIDDVIEHVLGQEGGYANNPADRGGETMWGITAKTARANGYAGPMRSLPRDLAKEIYRRQFVIAPGFDKIGVISPSIGAELVDCGVNMGPKVAARFLQRALNALNRGGRDYADIVADGLAGPATRDALSGFLAKRAAPGEMVLLKAVKALRGEHYIALCEHDPAQEAFAFGWLSRAFG